MPTLLRLAALAALALFLAPAASAQALPSWAAPETAPKPDAGPAGPTAALPPDPGGPVTQVPLDGGLALLALAGAALAARRLRD